MSDRKLILASASPRRCELLSQIGVSFEVLAQDIDESPLPDEAAEQLVVRLAQQKAQAALNQVSDTNCVVLGSDTVVRLDDQILGKPQSAKESAEMLALLSGAEHQVLTAVCVADQERAVSRISVSLVRFREISSQEALDYWDSGEPQGKAGSYAIQGLGAVFVESMAGSYSGVVGLPLYETAQLLKEFDVPCWDYPDTSN